MDFGNYLEDGKYYSEEFGKILENSKDFNGAEVAREMGLSRAGVFKITQRAMAKLYDSIKTAMGNEYEAFKCVVLLSKVLETEEDMSGIKVIFSNLSNQQKAEVLEDIRKNYPHLKDIEPKLK